MKIRSIDKGLVVGFGIMVLGAGLRFHGVGWGLPQVYEDAVPFKKAWMMWGWGAQDSFDLNPHFFNYPTLFFYIQFVGQAFLYALFTVTGAVRSAVDFQFLYIVDKTPFYLIGRGITALFGTATILLVYLLGTRIGGTAVAVTAALLLAVNTGHIENSKMVSVDVPLTFFVTLAILHGLDLTRSPDRKKTMWTGLALGLAASVKYTGALLALPIAVAHFFHRENRRAGIRPWLPLVFTLCLGAVAFLATSPFVVLDFKQFWLDLSYERSHMEAGHFGSTDAPTWLYYLESAGSRLLGWPALVLGILGIVFLAGYRRRPWALILGSFAVPYIIMINLWNMKADRYLLPLLPLLLLFAAAMVKEILDRGNTLRTPAPRRAAVLVSILILAAIPAGTYPNHLKKMKPDTRTETQKLIEAKVPTGGFIVSEFLGPELFGPLDFWPLAPELKERLRNAEPRVPYFGFVKIPMLQSRPEDSAIFYDLSLYQEVDLIVISSGIKSRYLKEPERFPQQVAFYRDLEKNFRKIWVLPPGEMTGPEITVYKNPRYEMPFAYRKTPPKSPQIREAEITGKEGNFYYAMGLSYESFGYPQQGLECYIRGLNYPLMVRELPLNLTFGVLRCYLAMDRVAEAYAFMDRIDGELNPTDRAELQELRRSLLADYPPPQP